jgi:hypothetical protein
MSTHDGSACAATNGARSRPSSALTPAVVALGVALAIQFGAHMTQIAFGLVTDTPYQPPYPIARMSLVQADLRILNAGNKAYLSGVRDYDAVRQSAHENDPWKRKYPYPPAVYRLLAAVNLVPGRSAHLLWLFVAPTCIILSFLATARALVPAEGYEGRLVLALTLLALLASTPLVFQIERGNFDWVVFTLYVVALAGLTRNVSYGSGILIGVATCLKLYPAIILPLLLLSRRFKAAVTAAGTVVAVGLVTGPVNNWQWIRTLAADRVSSFGLHPCNAGLANLIGALGFAESATLPRLSYAIFLLLVATFLAVAFLRQQRAPVHIGRIGLMAIPFTFLVPLTHWAYALFALVAMLPLLCALYAEREDLRRQVLVVSALIGITQSPFVAARCFPAGLSVVMPIYAICVLGLSLLSIWLVARGAADTPRATPAVSG